MTDELAEHPDNSATARASAADAIQNAAPASSLPGARATETAASTQDPPAGARVGSNWLRRFFWLDERIVAAKVSGFGASMAGRKEFDLARELRDAFEEIKQSDESRFRALLLLRTQVLLLIRCMMLRHGMTIPEDSLIDDSWGRVRQVPAIESLWNNLPVSQLANVEAALGSRSELYIIGLDSSQRAKLIELLKEMGLALMTPLETDAGQVRQLLVMRWSRVGVTAAITGALLWLTLGWISDHSGKVNMALNCPVTTSSQAAGLGTNHQLLVDGDRTNLGFHTDTGPNQFVIVDLGSIKKFDKVVVYNRTDCCKERAVPVRLEVSDDGVHYQKLADRTEVFDVWTAKMLRARGRYVRLRLLQVNAFHLSEVEIY